MPWLTCLVYTSYAMLSSGIPWFSRAIRAKLLKKLLLGYYKISELTCGKSTYYPLHSADYATVILASGWLYFLMYGINTNTTAVFSDFIF